MNAGRPLALLFRRPGVQPDDVVAVAPAPGLDGEVLAEALRPERWLRLGSEIRGVVIAESRAAEGMRVAPMLTFDNVLDGSDCLASMDGLPARNRATETIDRGRVLRGPEHGECRTAIVCPKACFAEMTPAGERVASAVGLAAPCARCVEAISRRRVLAVGSTPVNGVGL